MNLTLTTLCCSPQMHLACQVLRALEHGDLPLHAHDYQETAAWARQELQALDDRSLTDLLRRGPASLIALVENLLHERSVTTWCAEMSSQLEAALLCRQLLARL